MYQLIHCINYHPSLPIRLLQTSRDFLTSPDWSVFAELAADWRVVAETGRKEGADLRIVANWAGNIEHGFNYSSRTRPSKRDTLKKSYNEKIAAKLVRQGSSDEVNRGLVLTRLTGV